VRDGFITNLAAPARIPRRLQFAFRHFDVDGKRVLDIGCGGGDYLAHFAPGSVGLDLNPQPARARGLNVRCYDFRDRLPEDLGEFAVVWCSNILEHVLAPHSFLVGLRRVLRPDGVLIVTVPSTGWFRLGPWRGFLAADHVNFFTPRTLRHTLERAGYSIRFIGSPTLPPLPARVSRALAVVAPTTMAVANLIAPFQYPAKAHKLLNEAGEIVFKLEASRGD
jgi:SAM-dependent methyltransferase